MQHRELRLTGVGGLALHAEAWLPDAPPARIVVIAHGLAEHIGRYQALAEWFVARGYGVYALDHRGHGRSAGRRANIDRFAYLVSDLDTLVQSAARAHPGAPITLLGHSMGGAIAFAYAAQHPERLRALVLSAPALGAPSAPPLQVWVARRLSRLLPNLGVLTLPAAAISRDPAVVQAYETDPLVYRGSIPARTAAELLTAMEWFPSVARSVRLPVLVLHGTADTLVPLDATGPVVEGIGSGDKTLRRYEGLYHEVFNEPERAQVLADLGAWLDLHR